MQPSRWLLASLDSPISARSFQIKQYLRDHHYISAISVYKNDLDVMECDYTSPESYDSHRELRRFLATQISKISHHNFRHLLPGRHSWPLSNRQADSYALRFESRGNMSELEHFKQGRVDVQLPSSAGQSGSFKYATLWNLNKIYDTGTVELISSHGFGSTDPTKPTPQNHEIHDGSPAQRDDPSIDLFDPFDPVFRLHYLIRDTVYKLTQKHHVARLPYELCLEAFKMADTKINCAELVSFKAKFQQTDMVSVRISRHDYHRIRDNKLLHGPLTHSHRAYIGLGSNEGDTLQNIEKACGLLGALDIHIKRTSLLYETKPMYLDAQPMFTNAVCEVSWVTTRIISCS